MNDDTHMVYEGLANDEFLFNECEAAARYAGAVADDAEEFQFFLAERIVAIVEANRESIPGYSNSEGIDYLLVDYYEIAAEYQYNDYK